MTNRIPDIEPLLKAEEKHKEIFYEFLTLFAYLDNMVSFCIASYFKKDRDEKVEITDILISEFNSQKQFDIFLRILRLIKVPATTISEIEKEYGRARKMRNLLAHSYFVPINNTKFNGKSITLTRLCNSKGSAKGGKGYQEKLIGNDYKQKKMDLDSLIRKTTKIQQDHFK